MPKQKPVSGQTTFIDLEPENGIMMIDCKGVIDVDTAGMLKTKAVELLDRTDPDTPPKICIIMGEEVEYIDSVCLGALCGIHKRCSERGGKLAIAVFVSRIREIFEITGFDKLFLVEDSKEAAISRLKAS